MNIYRNMGALAVACGLFALLTACNSSPSTPPTVLPTHVEDHDGHDHAHAHDHGHAEDGPNGGYLIELGNEEFHGEWVHDDDSGKLTIYILDGAGKQTVPISASTITIEKKIGDKVDKYELQAVGRSESNPKSAQFEIVDKPLVEALKTAGQGVEATLLVDIEGKSFPGKIEHHEHDHHHGHKH